MPKPFIALTLDQFREMLNKFPFTREINVVHMHHTFRPNHAQYRGLASIEAMFEFHTKERKFADIAQHITIAPDGTIWTGRSWNSPPASATGHNGNKAFGPFMFEVIGDFDVGNDPFQNPQRDTTLQVIVTVQKRFGLPPDALRFHRQMANKSCPGTGIDRDSIMQAVSDMHAASEISRDLSMDAPFSAAFRDDKLTGAERSDINRALETLVNESDTAELSHDAELPESDQVVSFTSTGAITSAAARGVEITPTDLLGLRPHVINLNEGMLTEGGDLFTLPEDVERIFGEDMERAFARPEEVGMPARSDGEPFRIMIWAHGGLISEKQGLAIAHKHLQFWKKNGIYPIYFVWETGLLQTVGQLLRGLVPGTRNLFSDVISDPVLESTARAAGGEKIWSGMKRNAERAATPGGGATKVAQELKKFCDRHGGAVELHASGHSAGSIFHAHLLPVAFEAGVPDLAALHLLAPAIRVDTFKGKLLPLIGNGVKRLNLFTMVRENELADNCATIYRKSLLYLIRFSLEKEKNTEVLGLEECLRRDRDVAKLFGLGGGSSGAAEAIFSPSVASDGPSATRSISHGGFDDDGPTMNSIALRMLHLGDKSKLRMPYPEGTRDLVIDPWTVAEVVELQRSFASAVLPISSNGMMIPTAGATSPAGSAPQPPAIIVPGSGGRRRALCVGIDRYPIRPLAGCVADAQLWARTLGAFGFECDMLLDADATYANIRSQLEQLIESGRSGDVLVWQYSGHGTHVPDVHGDEKQGDSPGQDEAVCPVDLQRGRFFIDDEIGVLIDQLQPGVNFTMFIDCCHSGTINRFGFGEPPDASSLRDERARFLPLTDDLKQAYLQFAQSELAAGRKFVQSRRRGEIQNTSEILFSACLSTEVAWESNGHGEFTIRATKQLAERGLSFTNNEFMNAVVSAFGSNPRQTPNITCATNLLSRRLLHEIDIGAPEPLAPGPSAGNSADASPVNSRRLAALADAFDTVARQLREL